MSWLGLRLRCCLVPAFAFVTGLYIIEPHHEENGRHSRKNYQCERHHSPASICDVPGIECAVTRSRASDAHDSNHPMLFLAAS